MAADTYARRAALVAALVAHHHELEQHYEQTLNELARLERQAKRELLELRAFDPDVFDVTPTAQLEELAEQLGVAR